MLIIIQLISILSFVLLSVKYSKSINYCVGIKVKSNISNVFSPSKIGTLSLKNRLALAPMTRVSANEDGTVGPLMKDYYQSFVDGGFALVVTEGIYTDKLYSQCYKFQPGLSDEVQMNSWKEVTGAVHENDGVIIAQLMHAGALSQYNKYTKGNAAPSEIQPLGEEMGIYYGEGEYSVPKAMSQEDINEVISGFASAARLAKCAGFDGVEIHGANGYLLDQFLTVYTNKRSDKYGGVLANRLKIYKDIVEAVREAVGRDFVVGIRFSQSKVNDFEYKWPEQDEGAKTIFQSVLACGVDYIHTTEHVAKGPAFENGLSLASLAKKYANIPVIANGGISSDSDANYLVESGQADIVSLGKIALANPNWPNAVESGQPLQDFDFDMFNPLADLKTAKQFMSA